MPDLLGCCPFFWEGAHGVPTGALAAFVDTVAWGAWGGASGCSLPLQLWFCKVGILPNKLLAHTMFNRLLTRNSLAFFCVGFTYTQILSEMGSGSV